jgi:hypothetical protein
MTVEDWIKLILQSNVVAAIIVGIFGIFTLKMGIAKYASEKWWERRASAYASVMDGLHAVYKSSSVHAEASETHQEIDDDYSEELSQASMAGYAELQRGETIGAFLMSKRAASILRDLRQELELVGSSPLGRDHRRRADSVYHAILAMMAEAKRDLRT